MTTDASASARPAPMAMSTRRTGIRSHILPMPAAGRRQRGALSRTGAAAAGAPTPPPATPPSSARRTGTARRRASASSAACGVAAAADALEHAERRRGRRRRSARPGRRRALSGSTRYGAAARSPNRTTLSVPGSAALGTIAPGSPAARSRSASRWHARRSSDTRSPGRSPCARRLGEADPRQAVEVDAQRPRAVAHERELLGVRRSDARRNSAHGPSGCRQRYCVGDSSVMRWKRPATRLGSVRSGRRHDASR